MALARRRDSRRSSARAGAGSYTTATPSPCSARCPTRASMRSLQIRPTRRAGCGAVRIRRLGNSRAEQRRRGDRVPLGRHPRASADGGQAPRHGQADGGDAAARAHLPTGRRRAGSVRREWDDGRRCASRRAGLPRRRGCGRVRANRQRSARGGWITGPSRGLPRGSATPVHPKPDRRFIARACIATFLTARRTIFRTAGRPARGGSPWGGSRARPAGSHPSAPRGR
jgi:hypothetical protein